MKLVFEESVCNYELRAFPNVHVRVSHFASCAAADEWLCSLSCFTLWMNELNDTHLKVTQTTSYCTLSSGMTTLIYQSRFFFSSIHWKLPKTPYCKCINQQDVEWTCFKLWCINGDHLHIPSLLFDSGLPFLLKNLEQFPVLSVLILRSFVLENWKLA